MRKRIAAASAGAMLLTGCSTAVSYVPAGDPVLAVCQSPDVQNISILQEAVDNANNTNPSATANGQVMTRAQIFDLKNAADAYRQYADQAGAHLAFANALRNEAQEFSTAASSATGLTTNTVAVAADKFSAEIQDSCGSFQVGTAPRPGKPGPAIWDWYLFGVVAGGYLFMCLMASYIIAVGQRSRSRADRLGVAGIFWRSLVWWVNIFTAIAAMWAHVLSAATLTPDEKKNDRIAAQQKVITKLEDQLKNKK